MTGGAGSPSFLPQPPDPGDPRWIIEPARVVAVGDGMARVMATAHGGCHRCASRGTCNVNATDVAQGREVAFMARLPVDGTGPRVAPGMTVQVAVAATTLRAAAVRAFGTPLAALVGGALAAAVLLPAAAEGVRIAVVVAATVAGFAGSAWQLRRFPVDATPQVVGVDDGPPDP